MNELPRTKSDRRNLFRRTFWPKPGFEPEKRDEPRRDYLDRRQDSKWRFAWIRNLLAGQLKD